MNVTFKSGEIINGWTIVTQIGCSRFVAGNDGILICFDTVAGEGVNEFRIIWCTNTNTNRIYRSIRYLDTYNRLVRSLSDTLYARYRDINGV